MAGCFTSLRGRPRPPCVLRRPRDEVLVWLEPDVAPDEVVVLDNEVGLLVNPSALPNIPYFAEINEKKSLWSKISLQQQYNSFTILWFDFINQFSCFKNKQRIPIINNIIFSIFKYVKNLKARNSAPTTLFCKYMQWGKTVRTKIILSLSLLNFLYSIITFHFWNCPLSFLGISRWEDEVGQLTV